MALVISPITNHQSVTLKQKRSLFDLELPWKTYDSVVMTETQNFLKFRALQYGDILERPLRNETDSAADLDWHKSPW